MRRAMSIRRAAGACRSVAGAVPLSFFSVPGNRLGLDTAAFLGVSAVSSASSQSYP